MYEKIFESFFDYNENSFLVIFWQKCPKIIKKDKISKKGVKKKSKKTYPRLRIRLCFCGHLKHLESGPPPENHFCHQVAFPASIFQKTYGELRFRPRRVFLVSVKMLIFWKFWETFHIWSYLVIFWPKSYQKWSNMTKFQKRVPPKN